MQFRPPRIKSHTDLDPMVLSDLLRSSSFQAAEEKNQSQEQRLKELYKGAPLYYDRWRADCLKRQPTEMKDFRVSAEFKLFSDQITALVQGIKLSFLKRQKEEFSPLLAEVAEEKFKLLDGLAIRLLDSRIVTDEKRQGTSEAAQMYSDGKRYLEGIFYYVETAPFATVSAVIGSLLGKEKSQGLASLALCASGMRGHLYEAYTEFHPGLHLGLDYALETVLKQCAYEFMGSTPILNYEGNELHLNATLVNYCYKKLGLVTLHKNKIEDLSAFPPVADNKIAIISNNSFYRVRYTQREADSFVDHLNPINVVKALLERLTIRYHRDMQAISNYEDAGFFLQRLIKLAGIYKKKYDLAELHQQFFGYYQIKKIKLPCFEDLTESQKQQIKDNKWWALDLLEQKNSRGSAGYIRDLTGLCHLMRGVNDKNKVASYLIEIYEKLLFDLQNTKNGVPLLSYLYEQLLQTLSQAKTPAPLEGFFSLGLPEKEKTRNKIFSAYLKRSRTTPEIKNIPAEEGAPRSEILFSTAKIFIDPIENFKGLEPTQYCSLDQISKELKDHQTEIFKSSKVFAAELYNTILLLMLEGGHIKQDKFIKISSTEECSATFYLLAECIEFSWVSYTTDAGLEKTSLLCDYFKKQSLSQQLAFFKQLISHDNETISLQTINKIIDGLVDNFAVTSPSAEFALFMQLSKVPGATMASLDQALQELPMREHKAHISPQNNFLNKIFPRLPNCPDLDITELRLDILGGLALRDDEQAKIIFCEKILKKLKCRAIKDLKNFSANDILWLMVRHDQFTPKETGFIVNLESHLLKEITWNKKLFLACYQLGRRDFSGISLKDIVFTEPYLNDINFKNARLENIDFRKIPNCSKNFNNINFSDAVLKNTIFPAKINMLDSHFKNITIDQGTFSSFYHNGQTCFNNMIFDKINFRGIDFSSTFAGFSFKGSTFKKANFSGVNVSRCNFSHTNLRDANFRTATLRRVHRHSVDSAVFTYANLQGADLTKAYGNPKMDHTVMDAVAVKSFLASSQSRRDFREVEFSGNKHEFEQINFAHSYLGRAQVEQLYRLGIRRFCNINLVGQNLNSLNLQDVDFSGAVLEGVDFSNSVLTGACFTGATLGKENYNLTNFLNTSYANLNKNNLLYLAYQAETPLTTLRHLLNNVYLMRNACNRFFKGAWGRNYLQEAAELIRTIDRLPVGSNMSIQTIFSTSPIFNQMCQKHGTLYNIYQFCLVFETSFREAVPVRGPRVLS